MEQIADFIGRENMGNAMVLVVLVAMTFMYVFWSETHFRENQLMENGQIKVVVAKRSISFCGLLFIVLLLLKAGIGKTAAMGWSWWWVTAPLWGPIALIISVLLLIGTGILVIFLCYLLLELIMFVVAKHKRNKKTNPKNKIQDGPGWFD